MTTRKTFKKRVRDRQEKHGETYSTARMHVTNAATSTVEVRKAFRRMAEDMRAGRVAWMPGPKMDLEAWLVLPIVPIEEGVETPTKPLLVVDVGALGCPVRELLARAVLRKADLVHPDEKGAVFLGTVTLQNEGGHHALYRLPPPLGNWAAGHIGHTRRWGDFFPAHVGFFSPRPGYFGAEPMAPPLPAAEKMDRCHAAVREWRALDALRIAEIANPAETGSSYEILKVGVFVVDRRALAPEHRAPRAGVKVRTKNGHEERAADRDNFVAVDASRVALPIATARTLAGPITYRLPPPLAEWVTMNMALTAKGAKLFPSEVKFCRLDGRYTADFVLGGES